MHKNYNPGVDDGYPQHEASVEYHRAAGEMPVAYGMNAALQKYGAVAARVAIKEAEERCEARWKHRVSKLEAALRTADYRLREHGDTTAHPARIAIYELLGQA